MYEYNETVRGDMGLQFLKAERIGANLSGGIKSIIRDILTGFV